MTSGVKTLAAILVVVILGGCELGDQDSLAFETLGVGAGSGSATCDEVNGTVCSGVSNNSICCAEGMSCNTTTNDGCIGTCSGKQFSCPSGDREICCPQPAASAKGGEGFWCSEDRANNGTKYPKCAYGSKDNCPSGRKKCGDDGSCCPTGWACAGAFGSGFYYCAPDSADDCTSLVGEGAHLCSGTKSNYKKCCAKDEQCVSDQDLPFCVFKP